MATLKNKLFEGMYQGSITEYTGDNTYHFQNPEVEEFYFSYNVLTEQFIESGLMNLSDTQLSKIENKILTEHQDRIWRDAPEDPMHYQDDLEVYGQYEY